MEGPAKAASGTELHRGTAEGKSVEPRVIKRCSSHCGSECFSDTSSSRSGVPPYYLGVWKKKTGDVTERDMNLRAGGLSQLPEAQ